MTLVSLLGAYYAKERSNVNVKSLSHVRLFVTPWSIAMYQAPQPMVFSRQEYWSGLPFPSPEECSNYHTVALIWRASKVMLKILQARFQQYMNCELPDIQAGFRKARGTRDQIAKICWIIEKVREFQKNIYFCFIDCTKTFDCVEHHKLWKILKEIRIPDYLTCLLRNMYAGQEARVRTGHRTTDWFQIEKAVRQGCILSSS